MPYKTRSTTNPFRKFTTSTTSHTLSYQPSFANQMAPTCYTSNGAPQIPSLVLPKPELDIRQSTFVYLTNSNDLTARRAQLKARMADVYSAAGIDVSKVNTVWPADDDGDVCMNGCELEQGTSSKKKQLISNLKGGKNTLRTMVAGGQRKSKDVLPTTTTAKRELAAATRKKNVVLGGHVGKTTRKGKLIK